MTKANHNSRQQAINKARGYVPLWRDFWSLPIAKYPTASRLYLYSLCRAAHQPLIFHSTCGLDIPLQIGEFADSLKSIAEDLKIHRTSCRKAVKMLVRAGILNYRRVSYKLSVFTLPSYQEWKDIRSATQESYTSSNSTMASTMCTKEDTNVSPNVHICDSKVTKVSKPAVEASGGMQPISDYAAFYERFKVHVTQKQWAIIKDKPEDIQAMILNAMEMGKLCQMV